MARAEDIAWLAGLIDGEGCLSYDKANSHFNLGRRPSPRYTTKLSIWMCSPEAIERAAQIVGISAKRSGKTFPRWSICVYGRQLEPLLRELLPYLTVKRAQALMLMEALVQCPRQNGPVRLSDEQLALREGFHRILKIQKRLWQLA